MDSIVLIVAGLVVLVAGGALSFKELLPWLKTEEAKVAADVKQVEGEVKSKL